MAGDSSDKNANAPPHDKSFVLVKYEDGERIELGHGCFSALKKLKSEIGETIHRVKKRKKRRTNGSEPSR